MWIKVYFVDRNFFYIILILIVLLYMKLSFLLESCLFLGKSLVILYLYFFVIMFKILYMYYGK